MGKVKVEGKAKRECVVDCCKIELEIVAEKSSSAEASRVCNEQCESLVSKLYLLGIEQNQIEMTKDGISRNKNYNEDAYRFESKRVLKIDIQADVKIINQIRGVIESGFNGISMKTNYYVSNEEEVRKELMKEAFENSKTSALFLANSIGAEITGIDTANLSGTDDVVDLTEEIANRRYIAKAITIDDPYPVLNDLRPGKVTVEENISIVWLIM